MENFNQNFFDQLEYHLSRAFRNSKDKNLKWLWCDGIAMPNATQLENINTEKRIITIAYFGISGQDFFEMTIKLGKLALEHYAKNMDMVVCLPGDETLKWVTLDLENQKIEIQLQ